MKRYEYAKKAKQCRELEHEVESVRKAAKRANKLVVDARDELGLICFVVLKETDIILAAAEKIKKFKKEEQKVEVNVDIILKTTETLQDRIHKVHE